MIGGEELVATIEGLMRAQAEMAAAQASMTLAQSGMADSQRTMGNHYEGAEKVFGLAGGRTTDTKVHINSRLSH